MRKSRRPTLAERRLAEAQQKLVQARSELQDVQAVNAALYEQQTQQAQALTDLQEMLAGQMTGTAETAESEAAK